jgi:hypothetical protein
MFAEVGVPIDLWAIAALLESTGIRDSDAVERYGRRDVFALAQAVQVRLPGAVPTVRLEPPRSPLRKRLERSARIYARGMFFFVPLTLQLIALLAVGISQFAAIDFTTRQASVVAVAAALSFIVTAGFIQALGYLGPIYIGSGKHMLAESVMWRVVGLGVLAALGVGGLIWALAAVTDSYPAYELRISAAYFALLATQALLGALLYVLRRFLLMTASTAVALVVAGVLYKRTSLRVEQIHWIGLATAIAIQAVAAAIVLHRRAADTEGSMRLARAPRARLLFRRAFPFAVYGLVYFSFLTADRALAWASGSHPLPFWFRTPYELGLDWALGAILMSLAFLEITVENFSAMLVPTAERFGVDAVGEFNRTITRFWAKQLAYVAGLAATGTWIAAGLAFLLHRAGALGSAERIYANPVSHYVFGIGIAGYAFLSLGIANSVFLMSLNRPWRPIAAIGAGLLVSMVTGVVLTSTQAYWTAVFGMLAGTIVFAAVSGWQVRRTLRRADYFNYSAW